MSGSPLATGIGLACSHVLLIPLIISSADDYMIAFTLNAILVLFASLYYHLCRSFGWCVDVVPLALATQIDYYSALTQVPTILITGTLSMPNLRYASQDGYEVAYPFIRKDYMIKEVFVSTVIWSLLQMCVLVVVLTMDLQADAIYPASLVVLMSALGAIVKTALVDVRNIPSLSRLQIDLTIIGVVFVLVSLAFFPVEGEYYGYAHMGWHAFVFVGLFALQRGFGHQPNRNTWLRKMLLP
jgi:predicted membrane channel-forming protein YqfA (hemolysin III family)